MHRILPTTLSAAALLLTLAAPPTAARHHHDSAPPDLVQTATAAGGFGTLLAALDAADLVDTLSGGGPFTIFAPTDGAFAELPEGTVASLLEPANRAALRAVLTYHVIAGEVPASKVGALRTATTVNGQRVDLRVEAGRLRVDEATVLTADVRAANGIIHVIDRVLLPADQSIVQLAASAGTFETLLAAAQAAGLAGTLSDDGPFTLFAPTDEAFAALPPGTVESLLAEEGLDNLKKILTYHVLAGRVFADDALAAGRTQTLAGDEVTVGVTEGRFRVDDSGIINADLEAVNGVVHVIDRVLLPPDVLASMTAPESSPNTAGSVIRLAIERGVPLFNAGEAGACAAIYEVAATSLLGGNYELPSAARAALEAGLRQAARTAGARDRAWALRYALDDAARALRGRMAAAPH